MLKIVFLCSGGGGNLRFVAEAIRLKLLDAEICGVITDRECPANQFARDQNIWTKKSDFPKDDQMALIEEIEALQPDVIVTNVHKILSSRLVDRFNGRLLNLHYSLLPAFGGVIGAKPVAMALAYGAQFVGTTVHLVDEGVDTGKPLIQVAIPVQDGDDVETLMDIVFRCGCVSLVQGIKGFDKGFNKGAALNEGKSVLTVKDRDVFANPKITCHPIHETEEFWQEFKNYPAAG